MSTALHAYDETHYAKCIEVSRRIRWDIDRDVIRGRKFDFTQRFMPEGLSQVGRLPFLTADERTFLSQIQGRTYANMFRLVERFIGAKMLDLSREYALGDQTRLEALVRFTDEELKHQELFRRIELLAAEGMPTGYRFVPQADDVASFVLGKSAWAVLALTCHIEIFTQVHYRQSIERDSQLSGLWKDVFFFHWKEESQHAILDELEWQREDARINEVQRGKAIDDLIELVQGVDALLQFQAPADVDYFVGACNRTFTPAEIERLHAEVLSAYRWQYIVSGLQESRFAQLLGKLVGAEQMARIGNELAPIL
jgi:hypothetical protein